MPKFSTVHAARFIGSKLTGCRCRCGGCTELFNSIAAFDAHRVGMPTKRRCLSPAEMVARGMTTNDAQFWITSRRSILAPAHPRNGGDRADPIPSQGAMALT